jgi:small subunit ribosomal protein S20
MANHPSAEKRNRQRLVRAERNQAVRSSLRTAVKKARAAIAAGNLDAAKAPVAAASKALA